MDWSKIPDIVAVTLLICAFASVARKHHTHQSIVWLISWLMIAIHFGALAFSSAPAPAGEIAGLVAVAALTWAGVLFMWASVPHYSVPSSRWMLAALLTANTAYPAVLTFAPAARTVLTGTAVLYLALPLAVALASIRAFRHWLRWAVVTLNVTLSIFLLLFQNRPNGAVLALNAVLFAVYLGCSMHYWYAYKKGTTGGVLTVLGFLGWAAVFLVAPVVAAYRPSVHIQDEVWNLPKYVVAVGMILLFLEDQIAENRHQALHDDLTGLPNRRLFQDRLQMELERASRSQQRVSLLLLDLDGFKQVNDTLGHHLGDVLLRHVAKVLRGRVRKSDTVARTGGDEFSVILSAARREDATNVKSDIGDLLGQPLQLEGHSITIEASIGIAVYPDDADDTGALCVAADRNMYASKRSSRISIPGEAHQAKSDTALQQSDRPL